ncbi:hypothetical protein B296_00001313 [Ensete ventricosum]|uniref:Uncharacterized protein n=1 Tax=Ensete ventricosum TaxID=4639 RepID=A0A427B1W5_ENSVE|nr:hypothetical protein B296_00001313 [Ensete ventricosum]
MPQPSLDSAAPLLPTVGLTTVFPSSPIAHSRALLCRTPRCCLPPVPPCHYRRPALGSAQPAVTRPSLLPPLS